MSISHDVLSIEFSTDSVNALVQAKKHLQNYGCFIARGLLQKQELQPMQCEITQLIDILRKHHPNLPPIVGSTERFDRGFLELVKHNPKISSIIYNACRRLTSVHQLSVTDKLLNLSKNLLQTDLIMSNPYKTIRIDCQQREDYLLPWHQDYPYVQDSPDALIYWIPLQDVDEENGCMMVAPCKTK